MALLKARGASPDGEENSYQMSELAPPRSTVAKEKRDGIATSASLLVNSQGDNTGGESMMYQKNSPNTEAESYLAGLCEATFLSLWSYPSVYRDQGQRGKNQLGKEVCDLLVVFGDHIIIFSDKDCAYPDSRSPNVNWNRWFKRAVLKSAKQVFGAERWIRDFPTRLFLDPMCETGFPVALPPSERAIVHRVVVAHNVSQPCQEAFGGTGSLSICSDLEGRGHYHHDDGVDYPMFHVGWVDRKRGFVHVLDDTSLDIVMGALDTVADFVAYLSKKEQLFLSNTPIKAAGEEALVASYLSQVDKSQNHCFPELDGPTYFEGKAWERFSQSDELRSKLAADEVSYFWDELIERFGRHALDGTQYFSTAPAFESSERILRFMAGENRTHRRSLGRSLLEAIAKPLADHQRFLRVIKPIVPGRPYYAFLCLPHSSGTYAEYRNARLKLLEAVCMVVRLEFEDALDIVGIATESGVEGGRSEDALYLDGRVWNDEMARGAREVQNRLNILTDAKERRFRENEYPAEATRDHILQSMKVGRNEPCPCGSGKKHKRCCLPQR